MALLMVDASQEDESRTVYLAYLRSLIDTLTKISNVVDDAIEIPMPDPDEDDDLILPPPVTPGTPGPNVLNAPPSAGPLSAGPPSSGINSPTASRLSKIIGFSPISPMHVNKDASFDRKSESMTMKIARLSLWKCPGESELAPPQLLAQPHQIGGDNNASLQEQAPIVDPAVWGVSYGIYTIGTEGKIIEYQKDGYKLILWPAYWLFSGVFGGFKN
jgi:hypothetical protein